MPPELVARSWKRMQFTTDISLPPLEHFVADAQRVGFMRGAPDLKWLVQAP
jgi:NitT/TauT family transport system substrate-binding protein